MSLHSPTQHECCVVITCDLDEFGGKDALTLDGHKNIRLHPVFDVKHDVCHHGCTIVDDHLTIVPVESNCSGAVSLRGFTLLMFLV